MLRRKIKLPPHRPVARDQIPQEPPRAWSGGFSFPSEQVRLDDDFRNGLDRLADERLDLSTYIENPRKTDVVSGAEDVGFEQFLAAELEKAMEGHDNIVSVSAPDQAVVTPEIGNGHSLERERESENENEHVNAMEPTELDPLLLSTTQDGRTSPVDNSESNDNLAQVPVQVDRVVNPPQTLFAWSRPPGYPFAPYWYSAMDDNFSAPIGQDPTFGVNALQPASDASNTLYDASGWQSASPGYSHYLYPHPALLYPYLSPNQPVGPVLPYPPPSQMHYQHTPQLQPQAEYYPYQPQAEYYPYQPQQEYYQQPQQPSQQQSQPQPQPRLQPPLQMQPLKRRKRAPRAKSHTKEAQTKKKQAHEASSVPMGSESSRRAMRVRSLADMGNGEDGASEESIKTERKEKRRRIAQAPIFVHGFPNGDTALPETLWEGNQEDLVRNYPNHIYGDHLVRLLGLGWTSRQLADKAGGGGMISRNAMGKRVAKLVGRWKGEGNRSGNANDAPGQARNASGDADDDMEYAN